MCNTETSAMFLLGPRGVLLQVYLKMLIRSLSRECSLLWPSYWNIRVYTVRKIRFKFCV